MKISHFILGSAISLNLFVIACALIGVGHVHPAADQQPYVDGNKPAQALTPSDLMSLSDECATGAGVGCSAQLSEVNVTPAVQPRPDELPFPSGRFGVGQVSYSLSPSEMSLSGIANAELKLFIWYPAAINHDTSVGVQNVWSFSKSLEKFVQTHTVENAAIAGGYAQFPLILFSPAIGNESAAYLSQIENLVSHGYIVASLQSSESLNAISFQDTRLTVFEADMRRALSFPTTRDVGSALARAQSFEQSREAAETAKLRFAFNHVTLIAANRSQPAPFAGRIDLENVGAFGHGSGGSAVAQLCASDVRISACLDEDGWTSNGLLSQARPLHLPRQPFLWIDIPLKWPQGAELTYAHITRDQFTRLAKSSARAADLQLKLLARDAYRITLLAPDLNDKNFTDGPLVWSMKRGQGSAEARTALAVTNLYSRTFFDKYLKGRSASLFDSNTGSPFSEVRVRRYVARER